LRKHSGIQEKKPFGKNVEGLLSKNSRGDKTAIELFLAGVRAWDAELWRMADGESMAVPR